MLSNARIIVGGVLLVAAFLSGWTVNGWRLELRISEIRTELATKEAKAIAAVLEQEREIKRKHQEIVQDAKRKEDELNARIAGIRANNKRLQDALSACPASGDSASISDDAGQAVDLRSVVLGEVLYTATELAEYADRVRIAGEACVLSYEALRSPD